MNLTHPRPPISTVSVVLPGPDRRREPMLYQYRAIYRAPDPVEPGCAMVWEVNGGRLPYQVAAERTGDGRLLWHCTCADAVYRGAEDARHCCKHVRGLVQSMPLTVAA